MDPAKRSNQQSVISNQPEKKEEEPFRTEVELTDN
jgi:hypothetical protein